MNKFWNEWSNVINNVLFKYIEPKSSYNFFGAMDFIIILGFIRIIILFSPYLFIIILFLENIYMIRKHKKMEINFIIINKLTIKKIILSIC